MNIIIFFSLRNVVVISVLRLQQRMHNVYNIQINPGCLLVTIIIVFVCCILSFIAALCVIIYRHLYVWSLNIELSVIILVKSGQKKIALIVIILSYIVS